MTSHKANYLNFYGVCLPERKERAGMFHVWYWCPVNLDYEP